MKKLLATAALMLTAATASAQDLCMSEEEMTALMAEGGYVPYLGSLSEDSDTSIWFYINPFDGSWMIHTVDLNTDIECHLVGGETYIIVGQGA